MMAIGLNRPLFGDAPDRSLRRPSFRGIHVFVSGSTWTWYRPLVEGDQLYSFAGTESVVEKKSEFAERSVLITGASVKMNQRAEIVAIYRTLAIHTERSVLSTGASVKMTQRPEIVAISRPLAIHTERKTAREKGKYAELEPAT